jgi:hypothetical protein
MILVLSALTVSHESHSPLGPLGTILGAQPGHLASPGGEGLALPLRLLNSAPKWLLHCSALSLQVSFLSNAAQTEDPPGQLNKKNDTIPDQEYLWSLVAAICCRVIIIAKANVVPI